MKRLTKYDEFGNAEFVGIDNTKLYERLVCDETVALTIATNKLGELEDVLEKYGIESAEELDKFIHYKDCQIDKWKQDYENCSKLEKFISKEHQYCLDNWNECKKELSELKQKAIMPKEDKFVIVSNAWKHKKKYGIAKVQQIMTDHYVLQTDTYLGTYVPCIQFGEFATKEEAEQKLTEIRGNDE